MTHHFDRALYMCHRLHHYTECVRNCELLHQEDLTLEIFSCLFQDDLQVSATVTWGCFGALCVQEPCAHTRSACIPMELLVKHAPVRTNYCLFIVSL